MTIRLEYSSGIVGTAYKMVMRTVWNSIATVVLLIPIGNCSPNFVLFVATNATAVDETPLTSKFRQESLLEERWGIDSKASVRT